MSDIPAACAAAIEAERRRAEAGKTYEEMAARAASARQLADAYAAELVNYQPVVLAARQAVDAAHQNVRTVLVAAATDCPDE